jgi:signal transduction histidine kinase
MAGDLPQRPVSTGPIGDRLKRNRSATDASLRQERDVTDGASPDPLEDAVDATRHEQRARLDDDLERARERLDGKLSESVETLPKVASALASAAEGLSAVAENLYEAADSVAAVLPPPPVQEHTSEVLASVAETLSDAAGVEPPAAATVNEGERPQVVERLAEVAESLAGVADRVAQEREAADTSMLEERALIDRLLDRERQETDVAFDFERHQRHVLLEAARRRTNDRLTLERHDTDEAVHHSLELLHEEQMARARAEAQVLTRDEFLAIVSHDLRSPLDVIVINAALLAENAPPGPAQARFQRWAKNIERSAGAMERLLSDLLDIARFDGGDFVIAAQPHDAVGLVKASVETFAPLATHYGLRLDVDLPAEPVMALYDHDRMVQVMSNIVRNAIQFTRPGGSILISLTPVPDGCRIAVADTGQGIREEELSRIFERFRQLKAGDRRGLGLGLYIAKRIIDAHRGRIWVESKVGHGSTFFIELPKDASS